MATTMHTQIKPEHESEPPREQELESLIIGQKYLPTNVTLLMQGIHSCGGCSTCSVSPLVSTSTLKYYLL